MVIGRSGDERGDGVMRRAVVSSSQRECRWTKARAGTESSSAMPCVRIIILYLGRDGPARLALPI